MNPKKEQRVQILPGYLLSNVPPMEPKEPPKPPSHLMKIIAFGEISHIIERFTQHDYSYHENPSKSISGYRYYKKDLTLSLTNSESNSNFNSNPEQLCIRLQIWNIPKLSVPKNPQMLQEQRYQHNQIIQNTSAAIIVHELDVSYENWNLDNSLYDDNDYNNNHNNHNNNGIPNHVISKFIHHVRTQIKELQLMHEGSNEQRVKNKMSSVPHFPYPLFLFLHFPTTNQHALDTTTTFTHQQQDQTPLKNDATFVWMQFGRWIERVCRTFNIQEWFLISKPWWISNDFKQHSKIWTPDNHSFIPNDHIHESFLSIIRYLYKQKKQSIHTQSKTK